MLILPSKRLEPLITNEIWFKFGVELIGKKQLD